MIRRTPSSRIAQTLARYGIRCGGSSCSRPCRGRNGTPVPLISTTTSGDDGLPYGVASSTSSKWFTNQEQPDPPKIPNAAPIGADALLADAQVELRVVL